MLPKIFFQRLKNKVWHRPLSLVARAINFFPDKKITIIGITGTNGKTTTATLIYRVLKNAGYKTSLISTIETRIGDKVIDTEVHTTNPDKFKTFSLIKQMVKSGSRFLVAEVTAHAIDQHRFANLTFDISLLINTSHEHLDDFCTMDDYIKTKIKLLKKSKCAIINKDDQSYQYAKKLTPITYSIKQRSQYQAKNIKITSTKLSFTADNIKFTTDSNYKYQVYNILAAYLVSKQLKIKKDIFLKTIKNFPPVKGNREQVNLHPKITTIIDFAHTPKALEETLKSLKKVTKNRLIVIFGATGERDKTKRPAMGKAVYQYSNIGIITSGDTKNEDIKDINSQIISGIPKNGHLLKPTQLKAINQNFFSYFNVPNRQEAFNLAIKIAKEGDTIVACGKGHETSILHGETDYPWSEAEAFRTAFKQKNE